MLPIFGAEYPAEPKAAPEGCAAFGEIAAIAVAWELRVFGSLNAFRFNLFRDCSIGLAIVLNELGGAEAGSVPKFTGLAAVLTACNTAGSVIGATWVAAVAFENGSLKEYEGVAVAADVAAVGDGPLTM